MIEGAPDLRLRGVAFVRTVEGKVTARGTAERLDYRRAGGRFDAEIAGVTLVPEAGSMFGTVDIAAPRASGSRADKRGTASGGIRLASARGDRAATNSAAFANDRLWGDEKVTASGPGYRVAGTGFTARPDGSELVLHEARGQAEAQR